MSNDKHTAAPQRPSPERTRRTTAVIAQYIQDLSQSARVRRPRPQLGSHQPGVFPARVTPLPCS